MSKPIDITIRPIRREDAQAFNKIRRTYSVMRNTLALMSDRVDKTEAMLASLGENDYMFVAETNNNGEKDVIGFAGLHVNSSPRLRHSAEIGISVAENYQGRGVGKKLMEQLLDIADNWIMLTRVGLEVIVDNEKGLNLYKKLGFEIEGTKKYAVIRDGKFEDVYIMGRYNKNLI
ncbi:TPA: GNAT family N-acetyltransferase [Clostridioides difficile]|uniref:GNAT family N-acetyltransferase n=1 Tax=Clostridioides difficile TaxID=1496 RepID=UPI000D1FCF15|nr:GNAT family N-acetyltransferase [Clostridioides difficile]EGT4967441.1 GNAT family N-acetyltransferase [Clostridioides difficile]EGT5044584.1 GNAT family N-acetyltransferase [Clostridioides difficile]MBZ0708640.1 GNAT family N-acetyltransferase [Clostridioides difficile]MCJ0142792.1 GNAT family N-acetyltransferase [Clostridioides difficile]MDB0489617.1 GNAT family N-acetyltransferase [Clostridioides difficile]